MKPLLVRGGEVVTPFSRLRTDIAISDGRIEAIGRNLSSTGRRVIDAKGCLVLPGAIDPHTHMALPMQGTVSSDDFYTGTRAAAFGGVTTIIDFTEMASGNGLGPAFQKRLADASTKCAIDFALHSCVSGWSRATATAVDRLIKLGVTSFKMFTVYEERGLMSSDGAFFEAMQHIARRGCLVTAHCENAGLVEVHQRRVVKARDLSASALADSRPNMAEGEAVQRVVTLAEAASARVYIVHVSTKEGLRAVTSARERGVHVVAETCPQYLLLDSSLLEGPTGHLNTCVPPLRSSMDNLALWEGLAEGEISVVGTDHCPFTSKQKEKGRKDFRKLPFGLPGVETMLPLLYSFGVGRGVISINQLVQILSSNPAMIFGLYPRKGIIAPGSDADIVIFDPNKKVTLSPKRLHMNTDYNPYEGMKLTGWPRTTILRGNIIVDRGRFFGKAGDGEFLERSPA